MFLMKILYNTIVFLKENTFIIACLSYFFCNVIVLYSFIYYLYTTIVFFKFSLNFDKFKLVISYNIYFKTISSINFKLLRFNLHIIHKRHTVVFSILKDEFLNKNIQTYRVTVVL